MSARLGASLRIALLTACLPLAACGGDDGGATGDAGPDAMLGDPDTLVGRFNVDLVAPVAATPETPASDGYTSVLKTMQIMTDKGLVERDDSTRPQIYKARDSQDRTQKQMLTDLIQRVYGGSVRALVLHAIGTRNPTAADVDAMQKLLDRFERGEK